MNHRFANHHAALAGSFHRGPSRAVATAVATAAVAIYAVALAPAAAGQSPSAGMPMETRLMLKSVEIVACEPLGAENAPRVTEAIARRADEERARRIAQRIAEDHAGSVVEVRVRRERTVTIALVGENSGTPVDDTGWRDGSDETRVYFVPERAVAGCDALPPGSRWSLTQDPRIDCDTAPPVGLCVFDAVALPTLPQMLERYGETGATGEPPGG